MGGLKANALKFDPIETNVTDSDFSFPVKVFEKLGRKRILVIFK